MSNLNPDLAALCRKLANGIDRCSGDRDGYYVSEDGLPIRIKNHVIYYLDEGRLWRNGHYYLYGKITGISGDATSFYDIPDELVAQLRLDTIEIDEDPI